VVNPLSGDHNLKKPIVELPYYIRSNCFQYVIHRLGHTVPSTAVIKANLGTTGEIGYMVSNGIDHYVVVERDMGDTLLISDSNFGSDTIKTRIIERRAFIGFYSLK